MSDICLCYAMEDHKKMTGLVALFKEEGNLSVSVAARFAATIPRLVGLVARMVEDATVVVVLWSRAASDSAFLGEMRRHTRRDSTLVALLEKIEPPPDGEHTGVFDLSGWDGSDPKAELFRLRHENLIWRGKPQLPGPPASDWAPEMRSLLEHARLLVDEANAAASAAPTANPPADATPRPRAKDAGPPPAAPTPEPAVKVKAEPAVKAKKSRDTPKVAAKPAAPALEPAPAESSARAAGGQGSGGAFISYRRNDAAAYARGLYDRLAARFGRERVFLDVVNVGWGEDFVEAITAAAESCAVMIVLVSPKWARGEDVGKDDYVRLEVATALGRKIKVIPIMIQGASMPAQAEVPKDLWPLLRRNALALSDSRWERDVEDLIKSLEGLLKD